MSRESPAKDKIFKRVQEILFEFNKNYEKGFVEYMDSGVPNDWQNLLDQIDKSILQDSDSLCLRKLENFRESGLQMIDQYKKRQQTILNLQDRVSFKNL